MEKIALYGKLACALMHDLATCDTCKKCGNTAPEVRVKLVAELEKLFEQDI